MRLNRLSLTNFRAFSRLEMDLPGRILVLVGDNAQGKTSLIEAVYYLATFASFQAGTDRQMINFAAAPEPVAVRPLMANFSAKTTIATVLIIKTILGIKHQYAGRISVSTIRQNAYLPDDGVNVILSGLRGKNSHSPASIISAYRLFQPTIANSSRHSRPPMTASMR